MFGRIKDPELWKAFQEKDQMDQEFKRLKITLVNEIKTITEEISLKNLTVSLLEKLIKFLDENKLTHSYEYEANSTYKITIKIPSLDLYPDRFKSKMVQILQGLRDKEIIQAFIARDRGYKANQEFSILKQEFLKEIAETDGDEIRMNLEKYSPEALYEFKGYLKKNSIEYQEHPRRSPVCSEIDGNDELVITRPRPEPDSPPSQDETALIKLGMGKRS